MQRGTCHWLNSSWDNIQFFSWIVWRVMCGCNFSPPGFSLVDWRPSCHACTLQVLCNFDKPMSCCHCTTMWRKQERNKTRRWRLNQGRVTQLWLHRCHWAQGSATQWQHPPSATCWAQPAPASCYLGLVSLVKVFFWLERGYKEGGTVMHITHCAKLFKLKLVELPSTLLQAWRSICACSSVDAGSRCV